jgi:hypothetical protein
MGSFGSIIRTTIEVIARFGVRGRDVILPDLPESGSNLLVKIRRVTKIEKAAHV